MKDMTVDNIGEFKLYEILMFVKEDVKKATKLGIKLDMDSWASTTEEDKVCAVCLGGAAIMGFVDFKLSEDFTDFPEDLILSELIENLPLMPEETEAKLEELAKMLDELRSGCVESALDHFHYLQEKEINPDVVIKASEYQVEHTLYLNRACSEEEVCNFLDKWIEFFQLHNF